MPTSKAWSQLQCHNPLKAKPWLEGTRKASKAGSAAASNPRAEPREQHAGALHHRIAALANPLAKLRAEWLGRGLEAAAVDRELPAVERTAQAFGLVPAEGEVGAAMRAMAVDQAEAAAAVPEEHEVFAEQAHRLDRTRRQARIGAGIELVEQRRRLPVAAQQGAARRARADAG